MFQIIEFFVVYDYITAMKNVFNNQQYAAKYFGTLFAVIDLFYSYPNKEK
jgi:hypothetical protein